MPTKPNFTISTSKNWVPPLYMGWVGFPVLQPGSHHCFLWFSRRSWKALLCLVIQQPEAARHGADRGDPGTTGASILSRIAHVRTEGGVSPASPNNPPPTPSQTHFSRATSVPAEHRRNCVSPKADKKTLKILQLKLALIKNKQNSKCSGQTQPSLSATTHTITSERNKQPGNIFSNAQISSYRQPSLVSDKILKNLQEASDAWQGSLHYHTCFLCFEHWGPSWKEPGLEVGPA